MTLERGVPGPFGRRRSHRAVALTGLLTLASGLLAAVAYWLRRIGHHARHAR